MYSIGVDCGGTHIVGQLWQLQPRRLLKEVAGGSGNVVVHFDTAFDNLCTVLDQLTTENVPIRQLLIGMAGIESKGNSHTVQKRLEARYHTPVAVISDAKLALLNGLRGTDGSLIISGTGSIIYGRQRQKFLRVGGWGYLLGDEGSAFDMACTGLRSVLAKHDAGAHSQLAEPVLAALHVSSPQAAIGAFYAQSHAENAQLAQVIAAAAQHGNREAQAVTNQCARALANQALTLLNRYTAPFPRGIVLAGSVLQKNALFRDTLVRTIHAVYPQCDCNVVTGSNAQAVLYWDKWQAEK